MMDSSIVVGAEKVRYTHMSVYISEEDDGFTVQARLYHQEKSESGAWGEEVADSFETASKLVGVLAAEFSIQQSHIKIEVRMLGMTNGTRH